MKKLLVIDDSVVMRKKVARAVESIGFDLVIETGSCEEALQIYDDQKPEVISLNVAMPTEDGIDCVRQLKKRNPNVLIMAMSPESSKEMLDEAITAGARGKMEVPFDDEEVCSVIQNLMAKAVNETGFMKIPNFDLYMNKD